MTGTATRTRTASRGSSALPVRGAEKKTKNATQNRENMEMSLKGSFSSLFSTTSRISHILNAMQCKKNKNLINFPDCYSYKAALGSEIAVRIELDQLIDHIFLLNFNERH